MVWNVRAWSAAAVTLGVEGGEVAPDGVAPGGPAHATASSAPSTPIRVNNRYPDTTYQPLPVKWGASLADVEFDSLAVVCSLPILRACRGPPSSPVSRARTGRTWLNCSWTRATAWPG